MTFREEQQAKRIKELNARVALLELRIEELTALISQPVPEAFKVNLTPTELVIAGLLFKRKIVTRDLIMSILYSARIDEAPEQKICDVYISKIRHKLRPYDIAIDTVRTTGWRLDEASRQRMMSLRYEEAAP